MLFNSLQFLIFFAVLFFAYYAVPDRFRRHLLLGASCYFYMAYVPKYILILFFLIGTDFYLGQRLAKTEGKARGRLLWISIAANLGTLFVFKYFNFFNENVAALAHLLHWNYPLVLLQIALPIGLSFHVFQSLSYVIEVYKGKQAPETDLVSYALYVLFFSQLVAGPIERPQHFLPQIHKSHAFDSTNARRGLEMMLLGFFKKLVIADRVALIVDKTFAHPYTENGVLLVLGALAFTYQLYCDFSGYSDIAVGSALVFGYDLTNNFRRPFAAGSIAEFWRRWHISLSNWLKDYLYTPLVFAGQRVTKARIYASLFITFVLIGLWHGANWTFVVMGALHGMYLVVSSMSEDLRKRVVAAIGLSRMPRLHKAIKVITVYLLVTFTFVFFRATDLAHARDLLAGMARAPADLVAFARDWRLLLTADVFGMQLSVLSRVLAAIFLLEAIQYLQEKKGTPYVMETGSRMRRWAYYYALAFGILFFGYFGAPTFIYFKF